MKLDSTVPYVELEMLRPGGAPPFAADMPRGYRVEAWQPGDEADWARIETSVDEFDGEDKALEYFAKEFAPHPDMLAERMFFAVNPRGERVGTLTAWTQERRGKTVPMIHWLAVVPGEQGRGLAKALLAKGLAFVAENNPGEDVLLHTQTASHAAVSLYEKAHFSAVDDTEEDARDAMRAGYVLRCIRRGGGTMTIDEKLNQPLPEDRLKALEGVDRDALPPLSEVYVNNHIHTIYSFSPYSPTLALYRARLAGLPTAGIMDHDSVAGAREFARAGELLGVATTTGLECRVAMAGTPFADRLTNNPDQIGCTYMAMHGIPAQSLPAVTEWLGPIRAARDIRNRAMTARLCGLLAAVDVGIDYDRDVVPLSQWAAGGSITERHICAAASDALLARFPDGGELLAALSELGATPGEKPAGYIADEANPYRMYDLLGVFKSDLVPKFYIDATDECPPLADHIAFCREVGAISAYPYLGDVGDSVTGDKRAQRFEDGYLDELFGYLHDLGVDAITYMPSRNTDAQLARIRALCAKHGFFEISGEDINQPRQSFLCPALERPEFAHLRTATWALIGHERAASKDIRDGMFSGATVRGTPDLADRIERFAAIGRGGREE